MLIPRITTIMLLHYFVIVKFVFFLRENRRAGGREITNDKNVDLHIQIGYPVLSEIHDDMALLMSTAKV